MNRYLRLFLLALVWGHSALLLSQDVTFQLMEGDRVFGEDRCIGRSTEFELLFLDVKGEAADQLAEATLTLTSGGASEFFESYGQFGLRLRQAR